MCYPQLHNCNSTSNLFKHHEFSLVEHSCELSFLFKSNFKCFQKVHEHSHIYNQILFSHSWHIMGTECSKCAKKQVCGPKHCSRANRSLVPSGATSAPTGAALTPVQCQCYAKVCSHCRKTQQSRRLPGRRVMNWERGEARRRHFRIEEKWREGERLPQWY